MSGRMAGIQTMEGRCTKLSSRINQLLDQYLDNHQQSTFCNDRPKKRLTFCEPNYLESSCTSSTMPSSKCFCHTGSCSSSCSAPKSLHGIDLPPPDNQSAPACAKNMSFSRQRPYCLNTCDKCGRVERNCLCLQFSCDKCGKLNSCCVCRDIPSTCNNGGEAGNCFLRRETSSVESYKMCENGENCLCRTSPYTGKCFCTDKTHCCSPKYQSRDVRVQSSLSSPRGLFYEPSCGALYLENQKKNCRIDCKDQLGKPSVPCLVGRLSLYEVSSKEPKPCPPRRSYCPYTLKNKCEAILRKYESKPTTECYSRFSRTNSLSWAPITYDSSVCSEIERSPCSIIKRFTNCDPTPLISPCKPRPSYPSCSPKSSCQPCPSRPHFLPLSSSPPHSPCSPKPSHSANKLKFSIDLPKNKQECPSHSFSSNRCTLPMPKCDCFHTRVSKNQPSHWKSVQGLEEDGDCPCTKEKPVSVACSSLHSKPSCCSSVCSDASGSTRYPADVTASERYNTRPMELWSIKPSGWKWKDVHARPDILLRAMSHVYRVPSPTWARRFTYYRPNMPEWMTFSPTIRHWHTALCC